MTDTDADQPERDLAAYTRQRDHLLARIVGVLDADQRVRSAWLSGSFGRGEADAWSDFDLHVAVEDDELVGFWATRHDLHAQVGRPVLVQPEMKSNAQPGGYFQLVVFDGPLEVDRNIEAYHGTGAQVEAVEQHIHREHQRHLELAHPAYVPLFRSLLPH